MLKKLPVISVVAAFVLLLAGPAGAEQVQFTADLLGGDAEVPDPGPEGGSGSANVDIESDTSEVCFQISVSGIADPIAAHIHAAAAGVAGDVVVDFDIPANGLAGCVTSDEATVTAILAAPDGHYVNVHTEDFPAGAVRGQLVAASTAEPAPAEPAPQPEELAATGSDLQRVLLVTAVGLMLLGGALVLTRPRRTV